MQHLISPEGFDQLKKEWEHLKYSERPAIKIQIADAAAEGDRSENAAYTYGRMRLREIDRRLRELDQLLDWAKVVTLTVPIDGSIRFGATVELLETGKKQPKIFKIVGTKEIDPLQGKISMQSPLGKELIGKRLKESVSIQTPRGVKNYIITQISYL